MVSGPNGPGARGVAVRRPANENRSFNMSAVDMTAEERTKRKTFEIVVNGTAYEVFDETVTYEQVVALSFPDSDPAVIYSVAYRRARGGRGGTGTLVPGTSVAVKKQGTSFDVTPTTRS